MDKIILNIPHSSTFMPDMDGFKTNLISDEMSKLTDWQTKELFEADGVTSKVADFSRIYCDIERFYDEFEPMSSVGMGIVYTHTDDGRLLRDLSEEKKQAIITNFYLPYHDDLKNLVEAKLNQHGTCLIIDCHSFNDIPLIRELDQEPNRPDICIGTDAFHTPESLTEFLVSYFTDLGYDTKINTPFKGSLVPLHYYQKDSRVKSIMIEVNKKIYLDNPQGFKTLQQEIKNLYYKLP